MRYFCCDQRRRDQIDQHATLNGIDYLEVLDRDAPAEELRQRTLLVHCLKPLPSLTADHARVEGGERITSVSVQWATRADELAGDDLELVAHVEPTARNRVLVVRTDVAGDFSKYQLVLETSESDFDPPLARIEFSFKVECPTDFDCQPARVCPPESTDRPDINYLAKDFHTFRQLMLDRLSVTTPTWQDLLPADLGVTLVELLAYVADRLSYQQDAVATEAYLGTARRRVSVRRHVRLVDYFMHDGCNARTWVQLQVDADVSRASPDDPSPVPRGTPLPSALAGQQTVVDDDPLLLEKAEVVFETLHDVDVLFSAHNEISFYTWGDRECCLPQGATRATLTGHLATLQPGDVLIFKEVLGPRTGDAADADPRKRHAVRLTEVDALRDDQPREDPLNGQHVTEIRWHDVDALPFALCISARTSPDHGEAFIENVSIARGNIVLADHGRTVLEESLGVVPEPTLFQVPVGDQDPCRAAERKPIPARFRPRLGHGPLTHAAPYRPQGSASAAVGELTSEALPAITLSGERDGSSAEWLAQRDLLSSSEMDRHFVVEQESDSSATLRFGDDRHGRRPEPNTAFSARYRIGNGAAGNVGAETLTHIVTTEQAIVAVRNPLPARGGTEPETIEQARQRAPFAFRRQERAVSAADYVAVTERDPHVQRAAATIRYTGSWNTVFITADRVGGLPVDAVYETQLRRRLERYRMAGYDLEVDGPRFVPLEIHMFVCVGPNHFRAHVRAALLDVFSNRDWPDGRRGVFHPDNFTFGQTVYLSLLYAAAQSVPGVESARVTTFQRQGAPDFKPLQDGQLRLGRLEIARLDNDPNFPHRGVFRLALGGGK